MSGVRVLYFFSLFVFLVLGVFLSSRLTVLDWDAASYVLNGVFFLGGGEYVEWHRPPLWSLFLGFVFLLGGDFLVRLFGVFVSVLVVHSVFLLGKRLGGEWFGVVSALLFMVQPLVVYWSPRLYSEIPSIGLTALSFFFLLSGRFWLHSLFNGLSFLTRYVSGLNLVVSVVFSWLVGELSFRRVLVLVGGFVLVVFPWLLVNWFAHGNPFYSMFVAFRQMSVIPPSSLQFYFVHLFDVFSPPLFVLFVVGVFLFFNRFVRVSSRGVFVERSFLFLPFLLVFFYFLFFQAWVSVKLLRYVLPVLFGSVFIAAFPLSLVKSRWSQLFVVCLLLVWLFSYFWFAPRFFRDCGDFLVVADFLSSLPPGLVFSVEWPLLNYYSNQSVQWFPSSPSSLFSLSGLSGGFALPVDSPFSGVNFSNVYVVVHDYVVEPVWAVNGFFVNDSRFSFLASFNSSCFGETYVYKLV